MQTEGGDATSLQPYDDPLIIVNMSVWESAEALMQYVYRGEHAAPLLGADLTQLETLLRADAPAPDGVTRGGLRLDQATAAFLALTSPRRAQ